MPGTTANGRTRRRKQTTPTTEGPPLRDASFDAVIVGGGPGGATAAYWLARAGRNVLVVDKASFPREKVCGDGL
ncbi:MAG: FAD-dependent oxidoreductase, partial [Actinomycetota bacterium]